MSTPEFGTVLPHLSARELAVGSLDVMVRVAWLHAGMKPIRDMALLLFYAHYRCRMGGGRRTPVDIPALLDRWTETIVGLSSAHDHAGYTAADHDTDELLGPLLAAPIAQVREFAAALATRLESDPRVPFLVWSSFRRVIEPIMRERPDGEVIELRTHLAREIAELTEQGLDRGQLVDAIAGALQWRHPDALQRVKRGLEAGEKPQLKGRESCLFLEVGDQLVVL